MPQFDIFSFFSQLFWVFISFISLYLLLCFFLLPALSITLKVRKRKLLNNNKSNNNFKFNDLLLTKNDFEVKLFRLFNFNNFNSNISANSSTLSNLNYFFLLSKTFSQYFTISFLNNFKNNLIFFTR